MSLLDLSFQVFFTVSRSMYVSQPYPLAFQLTTFTTVDTVSKTYVARLSRERTERATQSLSS